MLRNPAQTLSHKTDICYYEVGHPAPKDQLRASPKGLCKAERGFLTAEASKRAAPPGGLRDPCPFSIHICFFPFLISTISSDLEIFPTEQHRGSNSAWKLDLLIVLGIYTPS